jgi:hypothetical protein
VIVVWPSVTNERDEVRLGGTYFMAHDPEDRSCVSIRNIACILYPDNGQCLKNILTLCLCLLIVLY